MLLENMAMAFAAIKANKMRSFLTMLGIIIGIGSVISIVSIGDTMRKMFSDLYKDIGSTQAFISVGYWVDDRREGDDFKLDEIERVKEVFGDEIAYVDSNNSLDSEAIYGRTKYSFTFQGINSNFQDVQPVEMLYGRYLNAGDILARKKNVVMEVKSAKRLFGVENAVGKTFRTTIYGATEEYNVIGIYRKEMNAFQTLMLGAKGGKGSAYIPDTILTLPNDNRYFLHVYAAEGLDLKEFYSRLLHYIAKQKGRNPEDFEMTTAVEQMNQVDSMMGILAAAVGGIAAISLLVGGIGIMNIMLVSVTERTREIGVRKSLGARTMDIMVQFLTESAIISACGGIIGIMLGVGLVSLGSVMFGTTAVIKPGVILMAVGFSGIVGLFFGIYPASKAAKADPIDALRYE